MVASFHQLFVPVGTVSMALGDMMLAGVELIFSVTDCGEKSLLCTLYPVLTVYKLDFGSGQSSA